MPASIESEKRGGNRFQVGVAPSGGRLQEEIVRMLRIVKTST